jgi:GH18 family chitinase
MKKLLWIFCILSVVSGIYAQDFKSIGYLPYYRFDLIDDIDFQKLTHVNIAFANPDLGGNLSVGGKNITPIVEQLHDANVDVFISLAGGALTSAWASAWKQLTKPGIRSAFIHKIMVYVRDHDLQGIDVDLEWSHVDENYSGFVLELRDSVDNHNLYLTAALPGTYRYPNISDAALDAYDWINMMVYDLTGPWAPNNPGPQSPFSFAVNSTVHWVNQGVSSDRLTLGMPFYGYDFTDQSNVYARTYRAIVGLDPDNAYRDQYGQIYYNGIPTIRMKTEYALAQLGGVMVWELGHDHFGEFSLLDQIDDIIQSVISGTDDMIELSIKIYPNPFDDALVVKLNNELDAEVVLSDLHGRTVHKQRILGDQMQFEQLRDVPHGMYILQIFSDGMTVSQKVIKR